MRRIQALLFSAEGEAWAVTRKGSKERGVMRESHKQCGRLSRRNDSQEYCAPIKRHDIFLGARRASAHIF